MARQSLAQEVRWLTYRNRSHARVLLCLMAKAKIGTADDRFVQLYTLAAVGPHAEQYVSAEQVDFEGLTQASAKMGPEVNALIRLAGALSDPPRPADITETFDSLKDTSSFEVALHALRLRWEL